MNIERSLIAAALSCAALLAHAQSTPPAPAAAPSPAKKALIDKVVSLQAPGLEILSRGIVERPVMQLLQGAGMALQQQVPADKREATGRSIEADARKFVEDSVPLVREKAGKALPETLGPMLDANLSEDDLKTLIAWLESPVNKKYQTIAPELQKALVQKLVADAGPTLDPKLEALKQRIQTTLTTASASAAPAASAPARSTRPSRAASGASR